LFPLLPVFNLKSLHLLTCVTNRFCLIFSEPEISSDEVMVVLKPYSVSESHIMW